MDAIRKAGRRSIRTRILVTLVLLTAAILLTVAAAFHLFIRAYVWGRVTAQLDSIVEAVSAVRTREEPGFGFPGPSDDTRGGPSGDMRGKRKRRFDGGQDRITGVRGAAVALDCNGVILDAPDNDIEIAEELAAYFASGHELSDAIRRKSLSLNGGNYLISVARDPERPDGYLVCYADVTAIQAFTRQANLTLLGIIFAAIVFSLFLSGWISRSFAEPIQNLSAFAEEIGRGDFRRREFQFRDAEFIRLAESMNRMADELRDANRKQETFFQNVSHELRTPLTAIRGNAEGIVCGLMNPQTSANVILAEADRLAGFVEDILYLSRMGRAAPEDKPLPLDLRDILSLCVSEQRVNADALSFSFDFDETPVLFAIRERDARQLFGNLISNAIRYAVSAVRLSCHAQSGGVCVRVSDDGPGITSEDLPHIFERFYKGAGGKHGIGLSIARTVVDAYHGDITAQNDGGAAFTVSFPAGTPAS